MADNNKIPDAERFSGTSRSALALASPDDVALLQGLVIEYIEKGPKPAERSDLAGHIAEHFMFAFPAVLKDPRAAEAINRMQDANSAHAGGEPLDGPPFDTPPPSAGFVAGGVVAAVAVVVAVGYIGLETLAAYCGDVHPAEGESAKVNC